MRFFRNITIWKMPWIINKRINLVNDLTFSGSSFYWNNSSALERRRCLYISDQSPQVQRLEIIHRVKFWTWLGHASLLQHDIAYPKRLLPRADIRNNKFCIPPGIILCRLQRNVRRDIVEFDANYRGLVLLYNVRHWIFCSFICPQSPRHLWRIRQTSQCRALQSSQQICRLGRINSYSRARSQRFLCRPPRGHSRRLYLLLHFCRHPHW